MIESSALDLPLPDGGFDRAYSQNVVMNIADKPGFYREALRVLRPGGVLALSNLGAGPAGAPLFPLPWASDAAASFLSTPAETEREVRAANDLERPESQRQQPEQADGRGSDDPDRESRFLGETPAARQRKSPHVT